MSDAGKGLTKWQVAAVVGAGVTVLVGASLATYVVCKRRKGKVQRVQAPGTKGGEPVEVTPGVSDGNGASGGEQKPKSQLEQALQIKQQGNAFFKQQKFEEAIRCYREGVTICPGQEKDELSKFNHNIAVAYDKMAANETDSANKSKHFDSVVEYCTLALNLNPRYIKALSRRAKAHKALGRNKDALLDLTRVLVLDDTQGAMEGEVVAEVLKDLGQEQSKLLFPKLSPISPTKHMVKTFLESFIWQDDLSEERLKELWISHEQASSSTEQSQDTTAGDLDSVASVELDLTVPDSTSLDQTQQAQDLACHEDQKPAPLPESASEETRDPYKGFSDDPFVRAAAMFREQTYFGIIELLTEAVEKSCPPFRPHALLLRGTMYILWRQSDKALDDLSMVVNTYDIPNEMAINALIKKASVHAGNSDMEKTEACFENCFALDSLCPDALVQRARVGLEAAANPQKLESVIEDLKTALSMVPNCPYAMYSLATAYHRLAGMTQSMQMLSQSTAAFEEARKKFPEFVDGLVLYAMNLQDLGQFSKAEELLKTAMQMEPDNSTVHFTLGILNLIAHNDPNKASQCFQKAISVDNSCIQAYDTLASIEMQKGNIERAVELYEQAVQFSRTGMEMGQALVAKEVLTAQSAACREFGISMQELASRAMNQAR